MRITEAVKQGKTFLFKRDTHGTLQYLCAHNNSDSNIKHIFKWMFGTKNQVGENGILFTDDNGCAYYIDDTRNEDRDIIVKKEKHTVWLNCYMRSHGIETGVNTYNSKTDAEKGIRPETESSYYIGAFPLTIEL